MAAGISHLIPAGAHARRGFLIAAVLVAVILRLDGLDGELGHDEAFSWLGFASYSYGYVVTSYHLPNNHILHSVLMKLVSQTVGHEEWMLRLPAFVAGVAAVPAIHVLARVALGSSWAGVVAAWLIAVHPTHISYSQTARGYSLLVLFTTIAWAAALHGVAGRRWAWPVFMGAGFLAAYTLPSGAFVIVALGTLTAAAAVRRGERSLALRAAVWSAGSLVATVLAYAPISDQVRHAGRRWGLQVWDDPEALAAPWKVFELVSGWPWGIPVAVAGALGVPWLLRRRLELAGQILWLVTVPLLVALATGVAGQARSYVYLLPAAVVLASAWIAAAGAGTRNAGVALCIAGVLSCLWGQQSRRDGFHGYAELSEALRRAPTRDFVFSPHYMEIPLEYYTSEAEAEKLLAILRDARMDRLLFTEDSNDPRSQLASFHVFDEHNIPSTFKLPRTPFTQVHAGGTARVLALSSGQHVFPPAEIVWEMDGDGRERQPGDPAFGRFPAACFSAGAAADSFLARSTTRFAPEHIGLAALVSARTSSQVSATLCGSDGAPLTTYFAQQFPLTAYDGHGRGWFLDGRLVPVAAGETYTVCARGKGAGAECVADLVVTYYPLQAAEPNLPRERQR